MTARMITPLPFTKVTIEDEFWTPRLRANREKTIPIEYQQCLVTGRIDAFKLDWKPGVIPIPHIFWDSDVAKWIEAASYTLATHPNQQLDSLLDEVILLVSSAQQPNGYLNTHFTAVEPDKRWSNLRDWHELYCAGHMIEAGVAHFQSTGKKTLLDVVCRYADYINTVFGRGKDQKPGYCGHEEIELALIKLYRVTGEDRYLNLSQFFIDERGQQPYYYDLEARARGEDPKNYWAKTYAYMQSHIPVRQQREVVGHAVRAMYLYSAMADIANEKGDIRLLEACQALWEDVCLRKMYITGGIGPARHNEGFTIPYDLPNDTAYAETCAAVALVFWNHRMLHFDCDRRYADILERALYNGVLSGVSLDGERFFYENPLASAGQHHRQAWFDCACCPPNIARLLASLGNYIYSYGRNSLQIHLYIQGIGNFLINGQEIALHQQTRFPWDGEVLISLETDHSFAGEVKLRLPGWCKNARLEINQKPFEYTNLIEKGYIRLERVWQPGDQIRFIMDMPVERIYAHPDVKQDNGLVALQRGPIVYCLEQVDYDIPLHRIVLPRDAFLQSEFRSDLLGGIAAITGQALGKSTDDWQNSLYQPKPPSRSSCMFLAIPYYAWDNRDPGAMQVWLPEA